MGHRTFDAVQSYQGRTATDGFDPDRDATYLVVPLRVMGESPTETITRAEVACGVLSERVDHMPDVEWLRGHPEACYCVLSNAVAALEALSPTERAYVLGVFPSLERLTALLS